MNKAFGKYASLARSELTAQGRQPPPPLPIPGERFIHVSVPWLQWAVKTSPGKSALLAALVLAHVAGLTRRVQVEVKGKLLKEFGLSRQAYYRGLAALEKGRVITADRGRRGKRVSVTLLPRPETGPSSACS